MKVLIIEDDKQVATLLKNGLEADNNTTVDIASDGQVGLDRAMNQYYDVVLLDLLLPQIDGIKVIKKIRESGSPTPIVVLSSKNTLDDVVNALNNGADDYIAKPFKIEEVKARLKAVVRRTTSNLSVKLRCGDIMLDTILRVANKGGEEIHLTTKEYSLLEYFMKNANKILSRASIISNVWNQSFDSESNIIDVYVKRLRNKFEKIPNSNPYIQSIRSIGYRFRERNVDIDNSAE